MRPLQTETHAFLMSSMPPRCGVCALPFAEEVVRQVAHPLGAPRASAPGEAEARVAGALAELLSGGEGGPEAAAPSGIGARLAGDAVLLAALFQNLDLLCASGCAHADRVSRLVGAALEASATENG